MENDFKSLTFETKNDIMKWYSTAEQWEKFMFENILNSSNNSVRYFNARVLSHPRNHKEKRPVYRGVFVYDRG